MPASATAPVSLRISHRRQRNRQRRMAAPQSLHSTFVFVRLLRDYGVVRSPDPDWRPRGLNFFKFGTYLTYVLANSEWVR